MNPKIDAKITPVRELREWVESCLARCRQLRIFAAVFRFDVTRDIVADVEKQHRKIAIDAKLAETADRNASGEVELARNELRSILADGVVDERDRDKVNRLARYLNNASAEISQSARIDHNIAEAARV